MEKKLVIMLDPGHGGEDPGAIGPAGLHEADVVLEIAKGVKKRLNPIHEIEVQMTRTSNIFVPLQNRLKMAREADADFFVSIHCNSFTSPKPRGTEVYVHPRASKESTALATTILDSLTKTMARLDSHTRGLKLANFVVLRNLSIPSTLVEVEFISNPDVERMMESGELQDAAILGISYGLIMSLINIGGMWDRDIDGDEHDNE